MKAILLTVHTNGIRVQTDRLTLGFYTNWLDYLAARLDWRADVVVRIRTEDSIFLPR